MRGLKSQLTGDVYRHVQVAPHVGAWIEIDLLRLAISLLSVAPHVGAWIEITAANAPLRYSESHPTWVRGLKFMREVEATLIREFNIKLYN